MKDLKTKIFSATSGAGIALFITLLSGVFVTGSRSPVVIIFIFFWVMAISFVLWSGTRQGWKISLGSNVLKAVAAFALLLLLSLIWSWTPFLSTLLCYYLLPLPVIFLVLSTIPTQKNFTKILSLIILSVTSLISTWVLVQYFLFYDIYGPRPHHPMLNPNNMATFINIALLWTIGLLMIEENKTRKNILLALTTLFYTALIITQSRAGAICFLISLLVLFIGAITPDIRASLKQFSPKLLKLGVLLLMVPFLLNLDLGKTLGTNANSPQRSLLATEKILNTKSVGMRLDTWRSTGQMISEHPWLGTGLGSFSSRFPRYRDPGDINDGFFAHIDPLQFWVEMGILAPFIFYTILLCALLRTLRALSHSADDKTLHIKIMAPFAAMLAVALHAHVSFPLYHAAIITSLSLMMSIWYGATAQALPEEKTWLVKPAEKQRLYYRLAIVILTGMALLWPTRTTVGKYYLEKVKTQPDLELALKNMDKVNFYMPASNTDIHFIRAELYLNEINRNKKYLSKEQIGNLFNKSDEQFKIFLKTEVNKSKALFRRAQLYHLVDGVLFDDGNDRALAFLREAMTYDPVFMPAYTVSAQILNYQGKHNKALLMLNELSKWPLKRDDNQIQYLLTIADTYRHLGNNRLSAHFEQKARSFSSSVHYRAKNR